MVDGLPVVYTTGDIRKSSIHTPPHGKHTLKDQGGKTNTYTSNFLGNLSYKAEAGAARSQNILMELRPQGAKPFLWN
jgi:hypothetical protein